MSDQSNPASRLHSVLSAVVGGDPNTRMLEVWAGTFELEPSNDIEVARRLIALAETLDEVKRLIETNPNLNHQRYLAGFPNIRNAIGPICLQLSRQQVISSNVTPEVLTRLEFCDEELRRYYAEEALTADQLSTIVQATNELFEMVAVSVEDATLRVVLLEGLEKVRIAISLYRIHGAKGLKSSLQTLLGIVFTEQESVKAEKARNGDVIARLGDLLDKLDSFSAKALKIHKALTKPVRFLLSLVTNNEEGTADGDATTGTATDVIEN